MIQCLTCETTAQFCSMSKQSWREWNINKISAYQVARLINIARKWQICVWQWLLMRKEGCNTRNMRFHYWFSILSTAVVIGARWYMSTLDKMSGGYWYNAYCKLFNHWRNTPKSDNERMLFEFFWSENFEEHFWQTNHGPQNVVDNRLNWWIKHKRRTDDILHYRIEMHRNCTQIRWSYLVDFKYKIPIIVDVEDDSAESDQSKHNTPGQLQDMSDQNNELSRRGWEQGQWHKQFNDTLEWRKWPRKWAKKCRLNSRKAKIINHYCLNCTWATKHMWLCPYANTPNVTMSLIKWSNAKIWIQTLQICSCTIPIPKWRMRVCPLPNLRKWAQ